MTSEKNAIYQRSIILSPSDPRIKELKWEEGDKFVLRDNALDSDDWEEGMLDELEGRRVVVEVTSYEIDIDGTIGYSLSFIVPNYTWKWWVPESMLEEDFIYLGKSHESVRFALILDE